MAGERILVVDDMLSVRETLSYFLTREGYQVEAVESAESALRAADRAWPDLVLTDLNMPGKSGLELLQELKARGANSGRDIEVIVVTAYGSNDVRVRVLREGAADYVTKPYNFDELHVVIGRVLESVGTRRDNERMRRELATRNHFGNLVGNGPAMRAVYDMIARVKDTRINCLVLGESGTGKEMVARAIHYSGVRADGPFVAVNCGAIPETLVESELFGYKKGAFTGAVQDKKGLLTAAHRGTLFLDEVDSLPLNAQVSLLRALQERRFTPVGDVREVEVDVRIIAATNALLEDAVEKGRFREDLYYRLNVVQINLPPLRERPEDIEDLVKHFVFRFSDEYGKPVRVSPETLSVLRGWTYPGNIRELQNIIERAVALCGGPLIVPDDLPARVRNARPMPGVPTEVEFPPDGVDLDGILFGIERRWLKAALEATEGNKTRAAELLGLNFRQFRYRLSKHGLGGQD